MSGDVLVVYKPFKAPDEIRLIVLQPGSENDIIHWHLIHTSLSQSPSYEALSYMWGNSLELMPAYNGQLITIRRNLWTALKY